VLAKRREIQLPPASFTILHTPPLPMQGKRFHQFLQTQTARRERQVVLPVGMMVWRFRWRALSRCTFLLLVRQKMSGVLSSDLRPDHALLAPRPEVPLHTCRSVQRSPTATTDATCPHYTAAVPKSPNTVFHLNVNQNDWLCTKHRLRKLHRQPPLCHPQIWTGRRRARHRCASTSRRPCSAKPIGPAHPRAIRAARAAPARLGPSCRLSASRLPFGRSARLLGARRSGGPSEME
jgi:hypothetical protein